MFLNVLSRCSLAIACGSSLVLSSCSAGAIGYRTEPETRHVFAADASCTGIDSLASQWNEFLVYQDINAMHLQETTAALQSAGHTVLAQIYDNTAPQTHEPLPSAGPPAVLSRTYPYALVNGLSTAVGQSYLTYAFEYQTYATGTIPTTSKDRNGGQVLYGLGPGSFESTTYDSKHPDTNLGGTALFLGDLGHVMLLLEQAGGAYSPTSSSSIFQQTYNGKTYLQHTEDALRWFIQDYAFDAADGDNSTVNHILRYGAAYILLGKALAQIGDTTDGCKALSLGAHFVTKGLTRFPNCVSGDYEIFPESPNSYTPTCSPHPQFDSSYQLVSVNFLVMLFANMPTDGIPDPTDGTTITPAQLFTAAIKGMNREALSVGYGPPVGRHSPAWCYARGAGSVMARSLNAVIHVIAAALAKQKASTPYRQPSAPRSTVNSSMKRLRAMTAGSTLQITSAFTTHPDIGAVQAARTNSNRITCNRLPATGGGRRSARGRPVARRRRSVDSSRSAGRDRCVGAENSPWRVRNAHDTGDRRGIRTARCGEAVNSSKASNCEKTRH